ncbi:MAG: S8 family serine peptidase, partial [Trueperaceae bacterium]
EPEPEPEVITLEGLQGVTGGPLRESAQAPAPNCVSPYGARPGQGLQRVGAGLQRVGAIGGLLLVDQNQFPGTLVAPIDVGTALLGEETTTGDITRSAVVLVVDDFTNGYELPAGIFTGAPIDQYADDVSHGALVMHHLLALGEGIYPGFDWEQGVGPGGQPYWRRGVELADLQLHYLYLQAVDVGTSSTDDVPAAIMDAVYYWVDQGVEDLVVNMSFAIVPCSVANDYDAAAATPGLGIDTFEKYLEALAEVNGLSEGRLDELDTVVSIPPQVAQDPLVRFVACPIDDRGPNCDGSGGGYDRVFYNFYFVASSGNYGGSYALYPARAPTVVSVGSIENVSAAGYSVSEYSNAAEIGAPGDYFLLSSANGQTVAYTGTSFAAPAVSVFLAFDAMHQPHRCEMPTWVPQSSNPDDPPVVPPPLIATGEYDAMLPFYTLDGSPSALDSSCYADD